MRRTTAPDAAESVSVYVPAAVEGAAASVRSAPWPRETMPVAGSSIFEGLNEAVRPAGRPASVSVATASAATACCASDAETVTAEPGRTDTTAGAADSARSAPATVGEAMAAARAVTSTEPRPVAAS